MPEGPFGGSRPFAKSKLALRFDVKVPNTREGEEMLERKAMLYDEAVPRGERPTSHSDMRHEAGNHIPNVILSTTNNLTRSEIYLESLELDDTRNRNPEISYDYEYYGLVYTVDMIWKDRWAMQQVSSHDIKRLHEVFIEGKGEPDRYRNESVTWPSTWNPEELEVESIYVEVF